MTEEPGLINRSNTICHYTHFPGFSDPNCNRCNSHEPKMVELLHLFAENGLVDKPGVDAVLLKSRIMGLILLFGSGLFARVRINDKDGQPHRAEHSRGWRSQRASRIASFWRSGKKIGRAS